MSNPSLPEPLGVVEVPDATVYTVHPSDVPHRMRYGVTRADGSLVESTVDDRRHGEHTFIPPDPAQFESIDVDAREVIYAGPLYDVYGHFFIESCQRLWWAKDHPDLPVVWTVDTKTTPDVNRWQREILDILGIENELVFITRPTRFELVHVPDAGYKYADWSHPQQIAFLAAYEGPPQQPGTKLWLSRDPAHGRGVINREIVERKLIELGWTVVTFEKMTVREQLDALARAELIAGEEASTFHNLLLLEDVSAKQFRIFLRYGPAHLSFTTIGDARNVDQQFHSANHDAVLFAQGRGVIRLAPNPAQYLSHLGVPIPKAAPRPGKRDALTVRRLNRLAGVLGAATFLQLGSANEQAFLGVTVAARDVVADEFDFDVRSYRGRGAEFYEVSLDQFLTWFAKDRTYELVLLDDRDWRTTVDLVDAVFARAGHERTVVVVDAPDGADLTVLALRYTRPDLDVRVVETTGPGVQVVVWQRRPGAGRRRRRPPAQVSADGAVRAIRLWLDPRDVRHWPDPRVTRLVARFVRATRAVYRRLAGNRSLG